MINKIVHFSDLHIRLFKDHELYRGILNDMFNQFREIKPDRIVFTGDLVHSKNQMTPELIEMVSWLLTECSKIAIIIIIPGNHDFITNFERLDALTPIINSLNNPKIIYYKDRGVYEDENVSWCVYSQFQGNIPPEISEGKGVKIGLFHGPISGLKTDLGYDFGDHAYDIVDVVYDPCTVDEMCATIHAYMEKHKSEDGFTNTLVTIDHSALFKVGKGQKDKFEMLYGLGEALTEMKKRFPVAYLQIMP